MTKAGDSGSKRKTKRKKRSPKAKLKAPIVLTPELRESALKSARHLTPRRITAELLGLTRKQFNDLCEVDVEFGIEYKKAVAEAKIKLIDKAHERALAGDKTMLIFLLKSRCGFREADEDEIDTEEKAKSIRESLSRMNEGLAGMTDSKGQFKKPPGVK